MTKPQYVTLVECKKCSHFMGINRARMKWDLLHQKENRDRLLLWYLCDQALEFLPDRQYQGWPGSGNRIDIWLNWSLERKKWELNTAPLWCRVKTQAVNAVPRQTTIFDLYGGA